MTAREQMRPERTQTTADPRIGGDGDGLANARAQADRLLGAADEAIARVLSTDSERFLGSIRQQGGQ
jgi:hypothetical protein